MSRERNLLTNGLIGTWWRATWAWLTDVPITDPVDHRNAPAMQLLFILIGCVMPGERIYYARVVGTHTDLWQAIPDIFSDVLMALAAWIGLMLIRRGRFRASVVLVLSTTLFLLATRFAIKGIRDELYDPIFPTVCLVIAGLVLGRLALWSTVGILHLVFVLGAISSYFGWPASGKPLTQAFAYLPPISLAYLMTALVIDRTTSAYHETLAEANESSRLLRLANTRISQEMEEREQAQLRLIHTQKLEIAGRVASGVAHDFDNVLGVIMGFAQRREQLSYGGIDALMNAMEGIELAARRGKAVSRRMLSFSRHDNTEMELFDAAATLRELMPMLKQLFAANVDVKLCTRDEPLHIRFDVAQFELVILNIAANARDAMVEGGHFVVEAGRSSTGNEVEIFLSDSGHGMSDDVEAHVFDAFYTTKPIGLGTGLGLTVAHDLVTGAGGRIDVESEPREGTRFYIRLPHISATSPEDHGWTSAAKR
jgi:signal transduction histidine kinase